MGARTDVSILGALLVGSTLAAGCADPARLDMAISELQEARAEAAARDGELAVMRERQAALVQHMQMLSGAVSIALARDPKRDGVLEAQLAALSARLDSIDAALARPAASPEDVDLAASRRAAEAQADERAATLKKVQALVESGQVKVAVRNGRMQFTMVRPLEEKDPYQPAEPPRVAREVTQTPVAAPLPPGPQPPPVAPSQRRPPISPELWERR